MEAAGAGAAALAVTVLFPSPDAPAVALPPIPLVVGSTEELGSGIAAPTTSPDVAVAAGVCPVACVVLVPACPGVRLVAAATSVGC